MAKRKLINKLVGRESAKKRWDRREERKAKMAKATKARLAKKTASQSNPNAEMPQQDEAGPSTSAASTEEAMEPPPSTPGPVPTPEMDEEILEFGFSLPSTSVTPVGDLVPFSTTPTAPMDTGETTPPPLAIDERSERIEQLEKQLKDRDDTIQFLREQVRNREALISDLRRQLEQCAAPPTATPTTSKTTPNRKTKEGHRRTPTQLAKPIFYSSTLCHLHDNINSLAFWMSRVMKRFIRCGEDSNNGGNVCLTRNKFCNNWSTISSTIGCWTPEGLTN